MVRVEEGRYVIIRVKLESIGLAIVEFTLQALIGNHSMKYF